VFLACASKGANSTSRRTLLLVDAKSGVVDRDFPDVDGGVGAAVADGSGGWYVGGSFTHVGTVVRPGLAHLRRDGSLDSNFTANVPGKRYRYVYALAYHGSVVYAGGDFGVVAVNAKTGKRLWLARASQPRTGISVIDLEFGNGVLYVAGFLTRIGGVARDGVAALDPRTGSPTSWRVDLNHATFGGSVAFKNDVVYLAGAFNRVHGVRRELGIAAVSPRTGLPTVWTPRNRTYGGAVEPDLVVACDGQIVAGGGDNMLGAYDINSGRPRTWPTDLGGNNVSALAVTGNTLYLGGDQHNGFDSAGGRPANNLAAVVLPKGVFTSWRPKLARYASVETIAVSGGMVLVGGEFASSLG
jgi:hypothetical protein